MENDKKSLENLIQQAFRLGNPDFAAELIRSRNYFINDYAHEVYDNYRYPNILGFMATAITRGEKQAKSVEKEHQDFGAEISDALKRLDAKSAKTH